MPRGGKSARGKRGGSTARLGRDAPSQIKQTGNRDIDNWKEIKYTNKAFEQYYKEQGIAREDEWDAFLGALKRDLPTTFRVTGSRVHAEAINDEIKDHYLPMLSNVTMSREALLNPNMQRQISSAETTPAPEAAATEEETGITVDASTGITVDASTGMIKLAPPRQLEWYPGQLAWQLDVPKRVVRKSEEFKVFQRFLVGETEIGNISRQEAVSMIPPLLLDIQSHHVCLDMCAAPGSKTAQMMEALNHHSTVTTGLLIANDADLKRCHMLVHQTGRMPSVGLGVTNNDASKIPTFKLSTPQGSTTNLAFDRILADVPCTGDGTLRKNLDIWKSWTPGNGSSLHPLQLRILLRAMQLLKPGGRMVYSTCSFNPVENEAVVAAALNNGPGVFRIVPQPEEIVLPGLKRRSGLKKWKIFSQDDAGELIYHPSRTHHLGYLTGVREKRRQLGFDESEFLLEDMEEALAACQARVQAEGADEAEKQTFEDGRQIGLAGNGKVAGRDKALAATLWAPENADSLGLEHGLRLLPHDQDTGGFYVCVIEKAADAAAAAVEAGAQKRAVSPSAPEGPEGAASAKKAKVDTANPAEEAATVEVPKKPAQEDGRGKKKKKGTEHIFKEDPFFYVKPDDPELLSCIEYFGLSADFPRERCFVRNGTGEANRNLYLSNEILKNIIHTNPYHSIRLLSAGIRIFVRQDTQNRNTEMKCKWRIPLEGLASILPFMDQTKILHGTIDDLGVLLSDMYPMISKQESGLLAEMKDKSLGCHVIVFDVGTTERFGGGALRIPLTLPIWRAKDSLSLLIDKKEKSMLSLRTFGQDITSKVADIKRLAEDATVQSKENDEVVAGAAPAVGAAEEAALVAKEEVGDATLEEAMNA